MSSYTRSLAPIALTLVLFAGACKEKSNANALAQDTTLSRDLQLANHDSSTQPQLKDVPSSTSAPATREPTHRSRPERPRRNPSSSGSAANNNTPESTTTPSGNTVTAGTRGSEGAIATVPAGTVVDLSSNSRICTNTNKAGDQFTATVDSAVSGIPAGATATLRVTELKRSGNATQPIQMTFSVQSLAWNGKSYPVSAEIEHIDVQKVRNASTKSDAAKVAGGAIVGAILGQVIGHNTKSTVIGGAAGAAAGTAVAMGTAAYEGCVPNGGNIKIKLTQPATIQTE